MNFQLQKAALYVRMSVCLSVGRSTTTFNVFKKCLAVPEAAFQLRCFFQGSISSSVQRVKGFNRIKGSIGSRVQLGQGFNQFKVSIGSGVQLFQWFRCNRFKGSISLIYSGVHLVQGLNQFKGLISSRVQLVQLVHEFNLGQGSISSSCLRVQFG